MYSHHTRTITFTVTANWRNDYSNFTRSPVSGSRKEKLPPSLKYLNACCVNSSLLASLKIALPRGVSLRRRGSCGLQSPIVVMLVDTKLNSNKVVADTVPTKVSSQPMVNNAASMFPRVGNISQCKRHFGTSITILSCTKTRCSGCRLLESSWTIHCMTRQGFLTVSVTGSKRGGFTEESNSHP